MKSMIISATKSALFDDDSRSIAEWLSGGPDEMRPGIASLFRSIPWLYRGVQLRANAVAAMPFTLYQGNSVYDTSAGWQNRVGFLRSPRSLFGMIEACLTLESACYLFRDRVGNITRGLRFIMPNSVVPTLDPIRGLIDFKRQVNGAMRHFKPVDDIIYFWRQDPYTEIGPSQSSPGRAALHAAGVLGALDEFIQSYFRRGAIKATLLGVRGNPPQAEREKLETWWNKLLGGIRNAWQGKVINADAVTATVIGEGLESLHDKNLSDNQTRAIAVALGIPYSLLFSDAANYATAQQDAKNLYDTTIVPDCWLIQEALNEQVFDPIGLRLEFEPETLEIYQIDEGNRATSLSALVNAGVDLLMAMDILGYDLTAEQRAALEQKEKATPAPSPQPQPETTPAQEDLNKWLRKSLKSFSKGNGANVPFESDAISPDDHELIAAALAVATSVDDIRAAFDRRPPDPLYALTREIRRANDLLQAELAGQDGHERQG